MSEKPLLFSYVRFSTQEQAKGHSLKRQLDYANKVAKERGLLLDESLTMRDLGLSAYHGNNIKKRLKLHNSSKGAKFTRGRKWKIKGNFGIIR
jgi:hypothetical protein